MISTSSVPTAPILRNLNAVLADIYCRYIALKKEDCALHYGVFTEVFLKLHDTMKKVDSYYGRYSSAVKFAGSHFDGLRINKPDEYDMDIVIRVPVSINHNSWTPGASDITIEPKHPGFVQLRAGVQYQRIPFRDGEDCVINRTAYEWLDAKNYILRSKFTNWFKSVVTKALNQLPRYCGLPSMCVNGTVHTIRTTESGPAFTLVIEGPRGFRLDVDLVPALKFPESRWPVEGYRSIPPGCSVDYWMVVPKPNKNGHDCYDESRSWRIALHEQERKLMHNSYNMHLTIKLLKKLRDSRGMNKIASYYIKTLFLWEIVELNDPSFWKRNDLATLLKHMLNKFHIALIEGKISYFWNRRCNLIGHLSRQLLDKYSDIVGSLLRALDDRQGHVTAAKYLLSDVEYASYHRFLSTN
ncbi:unnamed protein product [Parnassius mnemosyne]|uniref:Cyclic GMP-AMP synthase n=1 Tax=Parnassius mnemosyne TaxID=213953 RepID=A0AAV1M8G3_9NEOP